jgi:hypothetical protein
VAEGRRDACGSTVALSASSLYRIEKGIGGMKVALAMDDVTITLGNKGVTLTVADNSGNHVGHIRIGQATVEWRKGRTRPGNGKTMQLKKLIELLDAEGR